LEVDGVVVALTDGFRSQQREGDWRVGSGIGNTHGDYVGGEEVVVEVVGLAVE